MTLTNKAVLVTGGNRGSSRSRSPGVIGERRQIMTNAAPSLAHDCNAKIIEEFRANEGRVGGQLAGTPMILIHHIGARSGLERVTPLACSPQGDGRIVVVASNGGSLRHPDWYHNLRANPRITVELGTQTFTVLAEELDEGARAELWPELVTEAPSVGEFQSRVRRQIPVLMLTPTTRRTS
jgi:deazaflavin-dependent oxidoreductase (nitroreductase family)